MHRQRLLESLRKYNRRHPLEQEMSSRVIEFVERHPQCFERHLEIGHITGSCWLVDQQGRQTLLTHHRKLNKWLQLGGHADGESNVLTVALREAVEESGIEQIVAVTDDIFDLDVHEIPARGGEAAHLHYDCRYLLQASSATTLVISDESHDLQWVPISELTRFTTEESMIRMANKCLNEGYFS